MRGVALDVPVAPTQRPAFLRILVAVLFGSVGALITLGVAALALLFLGVLPRPWVSPGPFPTDDAWSVAADIVVGALIVLVCAWWIRREVGVAVRGPVSFGVVALAVAVIGYAPLLVLARKPVPIVLWAVVALLATTWVVRRYAIGTTPPFPRLSWGVWLALGLVGFAVLGSYRAYHPLTSTGDSYSAEDVARRSLVLKLKNSDWANLTILSVDGGWVGPANRRAQVHRHKLPYTLRSRGEIGVYSACVPREVVIRYSVLGLTSTQRFPTPVAASNGSFGDLPEGAGCDSHPNVR